MPLPVRNWPKDKPIAPQSSHACTACRSTRGDRTGLQLDIASTAFGHEPVTSALADDYPTALMEWDPSGAGDESAAGYNDNPWTSPPTAASSSCSNTGTASGSGSQGSSSNKSGLPVNPLYQGSPELGSNPDEGSSRIKPNNGILNPEATRPTLYRLTSGGLNGLLQGLDSLSFPNASQESISTEDAGPNGARRSLDELRRLSIKGKGRAIDEVDSSYQFLGGDSLKSAKAQIRGREALLHPVEDGDTLQRLALLYGCTVSTAWTRH